MIKLNVKKSLSRILFNGKNIVGLNFYEFDPTTLKFSLYGSLNWNGNEWKVTQDDKYKRMEEILSRELYCMGKFLNKTDYDFFVPYVLNNSKDEMVRMVVNEIKN